MIRKNNQSDIPSLMEIWMTANTEAHSFIPEKYWEDNFNCVFEALHHAEIFLYENDSTKSIEGFIGLTDNYIAGLFVTSHARSKGIGKHLLNHVKDIYSRLSLNVYKKNNRAVKFYLREGFTIISEDMDDDTGEIDLLMSWEKHS